MNEGRTTAIFGVVAAVALGLAWWSKPEAAVSEKDVVRQRIGEDVFKEFTDPEGASSMQIVKYDETLAQLERFEVAKDASTGLWTLPSHDGYPADAADQVKDATTPLIGLSILDVVSDVAGDHELYGVVNPDDEKLAAGTSGVGMLVKFKDDSDQVLASLVIGKEVEQTEGQRYVRIPSEDAVYQVELDTAAFSTEFRDWIEGELLGVRSMDITRVGVRDYTLEQSLTQVALKRNFDAEVSYDIPGAAWALDSMKEYGAEASATGELAEDEELNKEFLNGLRTAVQDLEIVNVQRKPKGLAADLKADDALLQDRESIASLQQQGFFAAAGADGTEIFSAGGETIIGTEEGVDYLLRFGEATASLSSLDEDDSDGGLSRYLLVTAKLNQNRFPDVELDPLPETVEEMLALEKGDSQPEPPVELPKLDPADIPGATGAESKPDDGEAGDTTADSGEVKASEASEPEAPGTGTNEKTESPGKEDTTEEPTAEEPKEDDGDCGGGFQEEETSQEESGSGEPTAEGDEGDSSESAGDQESTEPAASDSAETESQNEAAGETQEELEERLEALREEIAKENQRKIDERNDKIDAARKKVLELNARFSEWYYVVGDSVYQKLRVTRDDLIKKKESDEAGADAAAPMAPLGGGVPGLNPGGFQLPQVP